jgi:aryl-alcohol dehydrogenase-like predicted oxidoreductase
MPASKTTYPTRQLGKNGPTVSVIGFGAMGIGDFYGKTNVEEAHATLSYAADRGVTFWDTSDMYRTSEVVLGKWFAKTGRRSEIFLATKWGARDMSKDSPAPTKPNSMPSYILERLNNSLKDLQTDYIDLYYQHRVDPRVPIEVVLETLKPAVEKGTVRYIGLSECSIETLKRAKAVPGIGDKVVAAQVEFSPFELGIEKNGFAQAAKELGVAIVGYSPLCRGLVSGRFRSRADFEEGDHRLTMPRFSEENFPKNLELVDKFKEIADRKGASSSQIALAWILAEHPDFFPIPGCKNAERLEENAKGAEIKLTEEEIKEIRNFAEEAEAQVSGDRYNQAASASLEGNCIPLEEWKGE